MQFAEVLRQSLLATFECRDASQTQWNLDLPLSTGGKLGPYEILAPIGAGGMGSSGLLRDSVNAESAGGMKIDRRPFGCNRPS
jgi:hypothetical protein